MLTMQTISGHFQFNNVTNSSVFLMTSTQEPATSMSPTSSEVESSTILTTSSQQPASSIGAIIIDRIAAACTVVGFIANIVSLVTLMNKPRGFSPAILLLLRVQSLLDAMTCLVGALVILPPPMWMTGIGWLDNIVCYTWHGQAIYWSCVWMSIGNLINIAVDRYRCVCQPLKYMQAGMRGWYICIAVLPVMAFVCTIGAFFQTRLSNDVCLSKYRYDGSLMEKIMLSFAISTYFTFYLIPVLIFITLYSRIIYIMRRRQNDNSLAPASKTMTKATRDITKTAIVVTIIFILTIGYDLTYYVLGYAGLLKYKFGTLEQKIGVLLATLNNCANPFVYAAVMETYRHNIYTTWCPCKGKKHTPESSTSGNRSSETNLSVSQSVI